MAQWDREKILRAAIELEDALGGGGSGGMADLENRAHLTAGQIGDWDAGRNLAKTTDMARQGLAHAYADLIDEYRSVVEALRRTASNYGDAESDTLTAARGVDKSERPRREESRFAE
ncbi:hypothetical protein [Actinomadura harenae]|uniref:Uncharacterized protein n=1 Tax=Actinomadura harenae TaxID=2483351 RepID=A0A3M2MD23_9ACTN|nr:hypothetical protein [Actinomadura harenae]RMI47477.1 hypothetical protein EBO15_02955 [Actinomadura harenae]